MIVETLIHIDETLSAEQRATLVERLNSRPQAVPTRRRSGKPHLLFVAYDDATSSAQDLLQAVRAAGVNAQLLDL